MTLSSVLTTRHSSSKLGSALAALTVLTDVSYIRFARESQKYRDSLVKRALEIQYASLSNSHSLRSSAPEGNFVPERQKCRNLLRNIYLSGLCNKCRGCITELKIFTTLCYSASNSEGVVIISVKFIGGNTKFLTCESAVSAFA